VGLAHVSRATTGLGSDGSTCRCRRTALFLEESLYRGTQWVVFDSPTRAAMAQIRRTLAPSCTTLRKGAFQGKTPRKRISSSATRDHHPERHQFGRGEYSWWASRPEAGQKFRDHPDPADGRADSSLRGTHGGNSASMPSAGTRTRTSIPGQVGWPLRGRISRSAG